VVGNCGFGGLGLYHIRAAFLEIERIAATGCGFVIAWQGLMLSSREAWRGARACFLVETCLIANSNRRTAALYFSMASFKIIPILNPSDGQLAIQLT